MLALGIIVGMFIGAAITVVALAAFYINKNDK